MAVSAIGASFSFVPPERVAQSEPSRVRETASVDTATAETQQASATPSGQTPLPEQTPSPSGQTPLPDEATTPSGQTPPPDTMTSEARTTLIAEQESSSSVPETSHREATKVYASHAA
jgi:hypothetical protein